MDKVKHALGLDKSGSGGAQGMGDNRLDGHNTYDARAGGTGVNTVGGPAGGAYGANPNTTTPIGYNSNQGVGATNAATTGTTAPGYQEHHAQHQPHHGHHTGSGAVVGAVAGHHEGHAGAGALGGAAVGHEMGERGQHGHHQQHGVTQQHTAAGHHHQEGQQKEGMLHKIEAKMGMAPEQREAKKMEKEMEKQQHHQQQAVAGHHSTGAGAGGLGQYTNSGMMNDNLTGTGVKQGGGIHSGVQPVGGVQTMPAGNIREQPMQGQPGSHGNAY